MEDTEVSRWIERTGKCIDCNDHVSIDIVTYKRPDSSEYIRRERGTCSCNSDWYSSRRVIDTIK